MAIEVVIICVLALIPVVLQLMALNVFMQRMGRALRRAGDQPPFTTSVEISELGPEPRAIMRLLDRATRLDTAEIDALIDARGGMVPLPMSPGAAQRLVRELRQLGAQAETHLRPQGLA